MLHLRFIFIFSLSLLIWSLSGQNTDCLITISGKVEDVHHEEGLEFATIYIEELDRGTECDENGNFKFTEICKGDYHIMISHLGCQSVRLFISLRLDTTLTVFLEHHSALLDEIIISDNKSTSNIGLQSYTISGNTLQALAGKDIAQITAYIPGVNILKSGSGINKPIINGLYGNRIVILNQGVPQEGQQWGNDHAPEIDAFTSQKISVVKGSAAVRYGVNALSGVVILESMPIKNDPHLHGHFLSIYNTNGRSITSNLTMERSGKLTNFRGIFTYKKSGDKSTPAYYLTNTGSNEINIATLFTNNNLKWSRKLYLSTYNNNQGILRGSHIGNLTDLENALGKEEPFFTKETFSYAIGSPRQKVNHHLIKLENKFQLSNESLINIEVAHQINKRKEYDVRRGNRDSLPALDLSLNASWVDIFYSYQKNHSQLFFGIQNKFINNKNIAGTGILPLIPNYTLFNPALYFMYKSSISTSVSYELGARYDYQSLKAAIINNQNVILRKEHNFQNVAANIGLGYDKNQPVTAKFNLAFTHRSPQVHELYSRGLHQSLASIEEGNENLKKEISTKASFDVKWKPIHDGQINVCLYYHNIDDFIYLAPSSEKRITVRGTFPVFQYRQADVYIKGVDFLYNQSINHHYELIVKASTLKGVNKKTKSGLIYMPPFNAGFGFSYIDEKLLFFKDIKIGFDYTYTAKQNNIVVQEDFTDSPSAFHLLDVNYSFKQNVSKYQLQYLFKVENLFDLRYRDYLNRMRYFADETGRNISMKIQLIF